MKNEEQAEVSSACVCFSLQPFAIMINFNLLAVDFWAAIVPFVFIVIYLLNQLLSAKDGAARKRDAQRRREAAGERPLPPQPQPKQAKPPGQAQLNTEIEQFLKRANERRLEKTRRVEPALTAPAPRLQPAPEPPREQAIDVLPLDSRDFNSVATSVEQHLGSRSFETRGEHMVDDLVEADAERERHFKQVFDHRLGNFGKVAIDPKAPIDVQAPSLVRDDPAATANALAGILANQQNIRQAILLMEILERPIDRW